MGVAVCVCVCVCVCVQVGLQAEVPVMAGVDRQNCSLLVSEYQSVCVCVWARGKVIKGAWLLRPAEDPPVSCSVSTARLASPPRT